MSKNSAVWEAGGGRLKMERQKEEKSKSSYKISYLARCKALPVPSRYTNIKLYITL